MATFDKIRDIFYSGTHAFLGDQDSISEIAFLIDENYLSISVVVIASKDEYKFLLSRPDKLKKMYEAAGGGNTHIALKVLAQKYLKQNRQCESIFEHLFCGYYPDVLSVDNTLVVECGNTGNPEKVLAYFREGNIRECIQVPYPSHEDGEIKGYSFTAKDNLKEFLIFLEKEKRDKFKKIFLGRE